MALMQLLLAVAAGLGSAWAVLKSSALRSRCTYRVSGTPPAARWWSVTAYAEDYFLFPVDTRRCSVNGSTAALDTQGRYTFISAPRQPGNDVPGGAETSSCARLRRPARRRAPARRASSAPAAADSC